MVRDKTPLAKYHLTLVIGLLRKLQFTERGHIFVCVHLSEDMEMVMEGGDYSGDDDDYSDWEVDGPGCVPLDTNCNQFNTLSGYETADDRNSWETFELLLAQEQHSYNPDRDDHHWNFSDGNDVVNLVVSVEDTGVGIPLHVQERVFTPFMQVEFLICHSCFVLGLLCGPLLVGIRLQSKGLEFRCWID
jgi:histidine kinase 2/3/4 (cytokinin receptor)